MDALAALINLLYWLPLATWFGSSVFVAVAAPVIFRVTRESDPVLPMVLSVNLEGQHATLLAGQTVSELLRALGRVAMICWIMMGAALALQWIMLVMRGGEAREIWLPVIRSALYLAAVGLNLYDTRSLRPRVEEARRTYIDNADEPEIANPAKDNFDALHRESVTVLQYLIFVLLGLLLFSAINISRGLTITFG